MRQMMSAESVQRHMEMRSRVRVSFEDTIWRVIFAGSISESWMALVLRDQRGTLQTVEMPAIQQLFAEVEHGV